MVVLLICILANAVIGLIFNFFQKYKVDNLNAIVVNYFVCVITGSLVWGRPAVSVDMIELPWFPYALGLGALFIILFNTLALTVQKNGLTLSTIAQKMSLLSPVLIALLYYNDVLTIPKTLGIVLAILAIFVLNSKKGDSTFKIGSPLLLLITFLGSCLIDGMLFVIHQEQIAENGDIGFVAGLFFSAGVIGLLFLIARMIQGKVNFSWKDLVGGITLGVPNFFSIYLIMVSLENFEDSSVVFPILNVGILAVAAILGYLVFSERFTRNKLIGLVLAMIAIGLLAR